MALDVFDDCRPVFIVGAPRSGTTLVQRMLDAHRAFAILDEVTYFDAILQLRSRVPDLAAPSAIDHLFSLLPSLEQFPYWNGMEDLSGRARQRLAADPRPSYPKFYRFLMEAHAERTGKPRFGDKTPENVRYLPMLRAMFPRAQFLHIVRDPRGNVASRLAVGWSGHDVLSNALKWKLDWYAGRRFGEAVGGTGVYMEVRYEDLAADPERVLRAVCWFLGEPFEPGMLEFHSGPSVLFKAAPWKDGVLRPLSRARPTEWRSRLSGARLALVQWLTAREMRELGYLPDSITAVDCGLAPFQGLVEAARWARTRLARGRRRRLAGPAIGADASTLRHLALQAFCDRVAGAPHRTGAWVRPWRRSAPATGREDRP